MAHILFIPSSIGGHLGCFHLLSVMNNTAVDTGVQISVTSLALLLVGAHLEVELHFKTRSSWPVLHFICSVTAHVGAILECRSC